MTEKISIDPGCGAAKIIVLVSSNRQGLIARHGQIPWRLKGDMQFFRRSTMGHPIIMGRRTFESLPHGALPGRRNIVVSASGFTAPGLEVCPTPSEALRLAGQRQVFIIGGKSLYEWALPWADEVWWTCVDKAFEPDESDVYVEGLTYGALMFASDLWLTSEQAFKRDADNDCDYTIYRFKRT